jgi:ATP-dependent exoDNAse (exonuclease V) alpha subunit
MPEISQKRNIKVRLKGIRARKESWVVVKCEITDHQDPAKIGNEVVCTGNLFPLNIGMIYAVKGRPVKNVYRGETNWQLKVDSEDGWKQTGTIQGEALRNYLINNCPGIGEKKASTLINKFNDKTLEALKDHPDEVAHILGISVDKAFELRDWAKDNEDDFKFKDFLYGIGLTTSQIARVFDYFGIGVRSKIKERCFELVNVTGFGFITVCVIADKVGIPENDESRIEAAIIYAIKEELKKGNCCVESKKLLKNIKKLIKINDKSIIESVKNLIERKEICTENSNPLEFSEFLKEEKEKEEEAKETEVVFETLY